jgi:hypothetical protein
LSATFAGFNLCQTTPWIREWVERNIPLSEMEQYYVPNDPPAIFPGLTVFHNQENNIPLRLNVLRWPSGASRWATYHFLVTDSQLDGTEFEGIRAAVYGSEEDEDPHVNEPGQLILHGAGDVVKVDSMWLLPPRPISATPASWGRANKLWLCTLVDERYWWNQDHCGEMAEEDVGSWDDMLDYLREMMGITDTASWDCPAVNAEWLEPHIDLQVVNSLPLGMMLDAVAWNVGRKVSFDMTRTTLAHPPLIHIREHDWHNTRLQDNLTNASWKRLAGGEFAFTTRDLSAALPTVVRVTFSDGDDPRRDDEIAVNTITGYEEESGNGAVVFHDHLEWGDVDDSERELLVRRIAEAWLGFQSKATPDVTYAGHVKWLPEALSDAIEWHELNDEKSSLVPAPEDGKVRVRSAPGHMARTRVVRPALNQVAEDLWHGAEGGGSGSSSSGGGSGSQSNTIDCGNGVTHSFTITRTSGGYVVSVGS